MGIGVGVKLVGFLLVLFLSFHQSVLGRVLAAQICTFQIIEDAR